MLLFLRLQERIPVINSRNKGFLNSARRYPPKKVDHTSGLIIGSRAPASAKRLLPDYGSRRLIIDIEVTCSMHQLFAGLLDGNTVLRNDRAGKRIDRSSVHGFKNAVKILRIINMDRQHRAKQ